MDCSNWQGFPVVERDGLVVAMSVAAGLVGAYAELRQLQFLLQSVLEALLSRHPASATAVICTPSFVSALARVSAWLWLLMLWQMPVNNKAHAKPKDAPCTVIFHAGVALVVVMMKSSSL